MTTLSNEPSWKGQVLHLTAEGRLILHFDRCYRFWKIPINFLLHERTLQTSQIFLEVNITFIMSHRCHTNLPIFIPQDSMVSGQDLAVEDTIVCSGPTLRYRTSYLHWFRQRNSSLFKGMRIRSGSEYCHRHFTDFMLFFAPTIKLREKLTTTAHEQIRWAVNDSATVTWV